MFGILPLVLIVLRRMYNLSRKSVEKFLQSEKRMEINVCEHYVAARQSARINRKSIKQQNRGQFLDRGFTL